jgi:predicted thioredoxin/glutaredoxin
VTTLTLIGKPACHLCEVAEQIVETVVAELPADVAGRVEIEQASIADDADLYATWWEKIPVVLIDGELHAHWRVSADRLRSALLAADTEGASS